MMKSYGLVLITNVIREGSGEPVLLCNLVRVTLLTNSKFLGGWRLRPKQSRHLSTPNKKLCFKFYILCSPKRARNKRNKISLNWQRAYRGVSESSAFQLFIFSHLEVLFILSFHSERTLHIKKNQAWVRLACQTYARTHHKTLSCLLLCCILEGSKNHDPKRKLRYTSASRCRASRR